MTQEEQIMELNTLAKATLGRSEVHGIGVIALRDIKKGEVIYADRMPKVYTVPYSSFGKLFPEVKKMILERWPSIINGSKFIYPDARLVSFMNHRDIPNYDPMTDTALCDIIKGQEIFEDYRLMPNFDKVWPLNKNQWLLATNATQTQSKKSSSVVQAVKHLIRHLLNNWTQDQK